MCIIGRELCLTHTVSSNPCKGSAWYILGQSLFYRTVRLRLVKWFAQSHSKNKAGSAFDPSSDWALDPGCVTNTTPQVSAWAMLSESSRDFAKYWYARIQHLKELDSGRLCLEGFTSDPDALSGSLDNGWILFNMPSLVSRLVVELLNKDRSHLLSVCLCSALCKALFLKLWPADWSLQIITCDDEMHTKVKVARNSVVIWASIEYLFAFIYI